MNIPFPNLILVAIFSVSWILFQTHTISSEIIKSKVSKRHGFANKNDTYRQIWSVDMKVAIWCVMECSRDIECASVLYNTVTKVCQAHSVILGNPSVAFDELNTEYFVLEFGEHYIGDSCITSTDCWTINTECREGLCQCIPGYSFSPKTHECKVCDIYDDKNFMTVLNHYVSGGNMELFESVSLEQCKQLCLSRTTYVCVTFEFQYPGLCALQRITVLDFPNKWTTASGTLYSQRDCA